MSEDLRQELRSLTAAFRTHLELRGRWGAVGVPRGSSRPKSALPAAAPTAVPASTAPVTTTVTTAPGPTPVPAPVRSAALGLTLEAVRHELGDCQRCKLAGGRKNIVFGVGNPAADLVFVGEGPGADEDARGEPFVGAAGQLLDKMIAAMGFARSDVYICNVIKCRPPYNRNPEPDEVSACEPFLKGQLGAIKPRMIVALGKFAAQSLCREQTPISRLRGNFRTYEGIQVMPTFHPAFLLRTPEAKRHAWSDLQTVLGALARMGITPPRAPAGGGRAGE